MIKVLRKCDLVKYWPRLLTAIGWFGLSYVTAIDSSFIDPSFLDSWLWAVGAATVGSLDLLFFLTGTKALGKAVTFVTLVYSISRAWSYISWGIWAPAMVWLIVISLTLSAYRNALRRGGYV